MNLTQRGIQLLLFGLFFLLLVIGCAGLPDVTDLIESDQEAPESTPGVGATAPVELVVLEPTPTPGAGSADTVTPLLFVSDRGTVGRTDVYQVNSDGSGLVRLTTDPANDYDPGWSPDRNQIAFTSDRSGISQVYILTLENMEVVQLTSHPAGAVSPTWSPDGERIAFVEPTPDTSNIIIMESGGEGEMTRVRVDHTGLANLAWAPNGERMAFSAQTDGGNNEDRDIYTIELEGSHTVNLTNHAGVDDNPSWSPDGNLLAFQSDRDGDDNIYIMQADGSLQMARGHVEYFIAAQDPVVVRAGRAQRIGVAAPDLATFGIACNGQGLSRVVEHQAEAHIEMPQHLRCIERDVALGVHRWTKELQVDRAAGSLGYCWDPRHEDRGRSHERHQRCRARAHQVLPRVIAPYGKHFEALHCSR